MTKGDYERLSAPFRTEQKTRALGLANRLTSGVFYLLYPVMLGVLALRGDVRLLRCILVPAVSFAAVSAFRRVYNAPRPYEALDIQPLIYKDTKGKSFPSRHVFSACVISVTALWIVPPLGAALLVLSGVNALCRVLGGVHWPKDVMAGAVMGVLCGLIGYWFIT